MLKPAHTVIANQADKLEKSSSDAFLVEMVGNMVQGFLAKQIECSQEAEKINKLIGDKLVNMITLTNFECKKVELMLQNKYYLDSRGKKIYEQIQEDAMNTTFKSLGSLTDTTNLKLLDELEASRKENNELQEAVDKGKEREFKLQQEIKLSQERASRADSQADMAIEGLRSYTKITEWYETMIVEMKKDEDTNVKWYQTYKWRGGMERYAFNHPKPKVEEFTFDEFRNR